MEHLPCRHIWLLCILCASGVQESRADDAATKDTPTSVKVPTYVIQRVTSKITIDGRIDEADWTQATSVGDFVFEWWKEGMPEKEQTICKILWDDQYLYFLYVCEDSHLLGIHTDRDGGIPLDDSVEVYITPNIRNPTRHYAFYTNVRGALYDEKFDENGERILKDSSGKPPLTGRKASWDSQGVKVAVTVDGTLNSHDDTDRSWSTEVAVPFHNFSDAAIRIPPSPNDVWKLNPNRHGYTPNERTQYSQWAPTLSVNSSFFEPHLFGKVVFSAETVLSNH